MPGKVAGRSAIVEGDISEHAEQLIRQARLRRVPGKSVFQVAADVAERTAEDFAKKGAPLEADFVREVRDAVLARWEDHRQASDSPWNLDELPDDVPAWLDDLIPEEDSVYDQYDDDAEDAVDDDSEPDAVERYSFRERYATLHPIERKALLWGVALSGTTVVAVVYSLTSVLL